MLSSIDVAVNISAGIACPLWAPLKYVLLVAIDYVRAAEEILRMMETLKRHTDRFNIYQKLHDSQSVQIALLRVYTDIVKFSVELSRYFQQSIPIRAFKLAIRPFKEAFGDLMSNLTENVVHVHDEVKATELVRQSQHRDEISSQVHSIDTNTKSLTTEVANIGVELSGVSIVVSNIDNIVTSLAPTVAEIDVEVCGVSTAVGNINKNIVSLVPAVGGIEVNLSNLATDVANMQVTFTAGISQLDARITNTRTATPRSDNTGSSTAEISTRVSSHIYSVVV
ncbi:Similar to predicted protein [Trichoderma reesei QM6a]; acc. no. EGR45656 [Pyronema omphalodes CBS 100304]|uniref:DUF7708 domain-containing protein n=1 Tax=Pyronema omphalodes (strain CBS 100304) TaxID=1076935 RepID=U4LA95_PYROM|nr:Similar to predicted protein [Trichoderma reesei QM6a]; acc. no. EGR45656 [Pyronema omphalodes CBS 100304]